jgi:hypothetical protein
VKIPTAVKAGAVAFALGAASVPVAKAAVGGAKSGGASGGVGPRGTYSSTVKGVAFESEI